MCGIAAAFNCDHPEKAVVASLDKIRHRGGNVFEYEVFDRAALGANRLPIVGRMTGRQPLSNEHGTVFVAQNGEIFNHRQLRENLTGLGHVFRTDADTEVLVHAYEEYGPDMMQHLDSEMFAFVIYDSVKGTIFAARDLLGVKPLYYGTGAKGEIHFASELKQLTTLPHLLEIREFPAGHFYHNGKIIRYRKVDAGKSTLTETEALALLEREIVQAVRKRVDTDLPIGVFLSGGVDSSLVMEIATRLHPDVTAIILGTQESSDYQYALRLCRERNYKYHIIEPHVDYATELDEVLYHVESYEPLIVRHVFANWICSRAAQRLGLSIVLTGEGADELFAGYNEFSALSPGDINKSCKVLLENLGVSHLRRVDRAAMRFTVEARSPFLDNAVIDAALSIDGHLKIHRENHRLTTKYILRKLAARFLPDYIAWRYKMPFANGAGMDVGYSFQSQEGALAKFLKNRQVDIDRKTAQKFNAHTHEEKYFLRKYCDFGYDRLLGGEKRAVVKDTLYKLRRGTRHRFVVAEFDKLAVYFPVYLAAAAKIFKLHDLEVDFISTGGDDKTYASLANNSAQIGLADPLFAMFDIEQNRQNKGEIIGQVVGPAPIVVAAIDPKIKIDKVGDLVRYKVGTFQKFTTTHTIASSLLGPESIQAFEYDGVIRALEDRKIDVAIVLGEQALELEARGGHIVFNFSDIIPAYFFSGFAVAGHLESRHRKHLNAFTAAIREALKWMRNHPDRALDIFRHTFPDIPDPERVIDYYEPFWVGNLKVRKEDYSAAHATWRKAYPHILKAGTHYMRMPSPADAVIDVINKKKFRREYPFLEDVLRARIEGGKPLNLVGFWGAGKKSALDSHDTDTIRHFATFLEEIRAVYPPGVSATFILADKHAENNGYDKRRFSSYLKAVEAALSQHGIESIYLSSLWKKWKINHDTVSRDLRRRAAGWWDRISINKNLEGKSEHNFQGDDKPHGAQRYYVMRDVEKPLLEESFKDHIFIVYGDSVAQQIYPRLPTLYLWTAKGNFSPCPWFL